MAPPLNMMAKSDMEFRALKYSDQVTNSNEYMDNPRAFTSHIPEENSAEYNMTDDPSLKGDIGKNTGDKPECSSDYTPL